VPAFGIAVPGVESAPRTNVSIRIDGVGGAPVTMRWVTVRVRPVGSKEICAGTAAALPVSESGSREPAIGVSCPLAVAR